jgi:branched-chain amino acid transport system permease protein
MAGEKKPMANADINRVAYSRPKSEKFSNFIPLLVVVVLFSLLPLIVQEFGSTLLSMIMIYSILSLSYNLLLGYTGMISFGHAFFWGLGAYTVGILIMRGGINNFFIVFLAVIGITAASAVIFGLVICRASGIYFALINLALNELLLTAIHKTRHLTGGEEGLAGIKLPWNVGNLQFYYMILIVFVLSLIAMIWLVRSKFGLCLQGVRENEQRMKVLGYNTMAIKLACFIIAGGFGGIAGGLSAYHMRFVSPHDATFMITVYALLMCLIGGKGTLIGPIVGAVIITLFDVYVGKFFDYQLLIFGIMMGLVVIFVPQGLVKYIPYVKKSL